MTVANNPETFQELLLKIINLDQPTQWGSCILLTIISVGNDHDDQATINQ